MLQWSIGTRCKTSYINSRCHLQNKEGWQASQDQNGAFGKRSQTKNKKNKHTTSTVHVQVRCTVHTHDMYSIYNSIKKEEEKKKNYWYRTQCVLCQKTNINNNKFSVQSQVFVSHTHTHTHSPSPP